MNAYYPEPVKLFRISSYITPDEHFHFARKGLDKNPPQYVHTHDYCEVFIVIRGAARHFVNRICDEVCEGDIVFMRPDDHHAFQSLEDPVCEIINVMLRVGTARHFIDRYFDMLSGKFFWHDNSLPYKLSVKLPNIDPLISQAMSLMTAPRTLIRLENWLLSLLTSLLEYENAMTSHLPAWLNQACLQAHEPYYFRKGGAGLVEAAGRSHPHVSRQTKIYLGQSPTEYVNAIRMDYAARRLESDSASIGDIANDCGFENISYFYKLFRHRFGCTPVAYMRHFRKNPVASLHNGRHA